MSSSVEILKEAMKTDFCLTYKNNNDKIKFSRKEGTHKLAPHTLAD